MNALNKITLALLIGAAAVSCRQEEPVCTITADRLAVNDVAAKSPGGEILVITTDAPYWIVTAPDWIKADPVTGVGGGKSTIVTLTIESNYVDEATDKAPRSGILKFSGGKTSLSIPVNQLGHTGYIDPSSSIGGITDMDEFKDFIQAVNDGTGLTRWMDVTTREILLKTDLDLSSFTEWVPIGDVESSGNTNNGCKLKGNAFTGVFNGQGHTIRNFKARADIADGCTFGLFGALDNATVKNLDVEAEWDITASGAADAGIVAGTMYCSTVENVKVTATIRSEGTTSTKRFAIGGIAGFVYSVYDSAEGVSFDSLIKDCTVTADVTLKAGSNTANGAAGMMYGGMAAFATNVKDASFIRIENCVNNGTMVTDIGRCSGILPTANYGTVIKDCTNNAAQVNTNANGRIGQICCNLSYNSSLIGCVNNGDLTTTGSSTTTGALVALIGDDSVVIEGGDKVANTGVILGCNTKYLSLLCANNNKFDHVSGVRLSGRIGVYKADGNHEMYPVNSSNIMEYIGYINPDYAGKITDITYEGSGPETETPEAGGSIGDLDPVNDTWN